MNEEIAANEPIDPIPDVKVETIEAIAAAEPPAEPEPVPETFEPATEAVESIPVDQSPAPGLELPKENQLSPSSYRSND